MNKSQAVGLILSVVLSVTMLMPMVARAGECEDAGRMVVMLSQISAQCTRYALSAEGQKINRAMLVEVARLGGSKSDECILRARGPVLDEFGTKSMARLVAEGDTAQFQVLFCEEIATYLSQLASFSKKPKLYQRK